MPINIDGIVQNRNKKCTNVQPLCMEEYLQQMNVDV